MFASAATHYSLPGGDREPRAGNTRPSVVIAGSGKDAEILVALADGRDLSMGAGVVTVSADSAVQARITRLDDVNVEIRYCGPGLTARSVRVKYDSRDPEWQDELREDVRAWLANDSSSELNYCVDADIVLAADGR